MPDPIKLEASSRGVRELGIVLKVPVDESLPLYFFCNVSHVAYTNNRDCLSSTGTSFLSSVRNFSD